MVKDEHGEAKYEFWIKLVVVAVKYGQQTETKENHISIN